MEDDEVHEFLIQKPTVQQSNNISSVQIIPLTCIDRYLCCCINHYLITKEEYSLFISIQQQTRIKYSKSNQVHESKLNRFNEECKKLLHETRSNSKNEVLWKLYGFQTNEPRNDFRDGGIHSLDFMTYFIEEHSSEAKELFQIEQFSFATCAIEVTFKLRQLLCLENNPGSSLTRKGLKEFIENYIEDNQIMFKIESEVMIYIKEKLEHSDKDKIIYNNAVNNMMSNMISRGINCCGEALNSKTNSKQEIILRLKHLLKNNIY